MAKGVLEESDEATAAIRLGKIGDSVDASGPITYALLEDPNDPDKYDNEHFSITESDGAYYLYYKGAALDYDNPEAQKIFIVNVVRERGGISEQLQYPINVQNINEHAPILTAEGGTVRGSKN